jgi:DNA-binding transcriptional LysR family regulator
VTARIRNLESQLGCRLFVRNRAGARLTSHGERFVARASQLVRTWDAARRELPLPDDADRRLSLGGELSLWNPLLLSWLAAVRERLPQIAVRAEVAERRTLHEKIEQGLVDAALVHQPEYGPGIQVEELLEEKLILVRAPASADPYVYVDWGENFRRLHDAAHPERTHTPISTNLGPLALQLLLQQGGSGYFRTRVVQPFLEQGLLQRDPSAPEFSYPVFLVRARELAEARLREAFDILRALVAEPGTGWHA